MENVQIKRKTMGVTGPLQKVIKIKNVSHVTHFITESCHCRQIRYDNDMVSWCVGVIFQKQEKARHNTATPLNTRCRLHTEWMEWRVSNGWRRGYAQALGLGRDIRDTFPKCFPNCPHTV